MPWALICDLDGTLALFGKRRSAYDASLCDLTDEPNLSVLNLLRTYEYLYQQSKGVVTTPDKIFFFSGREDKYRGPTIRFLWNKCGFDVVLNKFFQLIMRETGDNRPDEIVKKEMFDTYIKEQYNVNVVVDDRPKVIRMWHSLGLPVFNVGDGHEF